MNHGVRLLRIVVAVAVSATALLGCQVQPSNDFPEGMTATATVTRVTITEVISIAGQVSPLDSRELRFQTVGGRVEEILAGTGQVVSAGDALVRLDTSDLERGLREAEADLVVAEVELEEARKSVSAARVALAEAELANAEYQLAAARLDLDLATQIGLGPLEEAVADKKVALQQARDSLALQELMANQTQIRDLEYQRAFFQRALRDLKPGEDPTESQRALESVERDLAGARAAREETLDRERDAIEKAEKELEVAQLALERARSGQFDPVAEYRLAYERALTARDKAQERLEEMTAGTDSGALEQARTVYEAAVAKVELIDNRLGQFLKISSANAIGDAAVDGVFRASSIFGLTVARDESGADVGTLVIGEHGQKILVKVSLERALEDLEKEKEPVDAD